MTLRSINIEKILREYNSKQNFIDELEKASLRLKGQNKTRLLEVMIYYSNLFEIEKNMTHDVIEFKSLALSNVDLFNKLYISYNIPVLKFLSDIIQFNLNYVEKIKSLG